MGAILCYIYADNYIEVGKKGEGKQRENGARNEAKKTKRLFNRVCSSAFSEKADLMSK